MTASNSFFLRNRLTVVLIALISIIPFSFAWYLAKNPHLVKDLHKGNYGHLITPAKPIDYAELFQTPITAGESLPEIKGRWVMVQVSTESVCNDACKETVQKTGRIRLMLNKEIPRVRRVLLFPGHADAAATEELAKLDPTLQMAGMSESLQKRLQESVGGPIPEGAVLLLDPLANLMMWYDPNFDPYGLLRDLQKLLRISQIG